MSDAIKLPPQNTEAEQSVLGSLLLDKDALIKVADFLRADDFYRDDHKDIYQAILKLYEKRKPIDVLTLTDILEKEKKLKEIGGATYLTTLVNAVPTAANVVTYAQIIQQKATLRRLISTATTIVELGYDEETEMETLLDKAESSLFAVSQKYIKQYFTPIKDILAESFDRIDKLHKEKGSIRGVPTGFRDLDNLLAGLQKSDLVILAARPSIGKSSLALNFVDHIACDKKIPVGIFSMEMSKDQIIDRLLCLRGAVDSWKLRTGNLDDDDFGKLNYAMGMLSEAPIFIDDTPVINSMEIRTKARRLQAEQGLGLIVIDYLQLMQGSAKANSDSRVQEVSEISRNLKGLARELNVPVLALSQLSRAVEHRDNKRPMLADLRESGCLAGDTLITLADTGEMLPIKELVGKKNISILSLNKNLKLEKKTVRKVFASGRKKVYKIKMRSGRSIEASANHPFLTIEGWKRLGELKEGDFIAVTKCHSERFQVCSEESLANARSRTSREILHLTVQDDKATDIYWDEIMSIESRGVEEVYDAEIPGNHNFVANDIVVHNSIEQDADVVMFIYRDDYYDKETENQNIAEILIRKHRNGPTGDVQLFWKPEYMKFGTLDKKMTSSE